MRHLKVSHNYISLKMKYKEEFPQLNSQKLLNDGFGHMEEVLDEDVDNIDAEHKTLNDTRPEDNEKILQLQQQPSEANLAREQQVHEIAKLKASITKQQKSLKIGINKSNSGQINIRADNFVYDEDSDTIKVLDYDTLDKELEQHCTSQEKDRETKISQMRSRVLSQVKGIERARRGRNPSVCSVRSVNSGVGTVRGRSDTEDDEEIASKNPRLQFQSLLPTLKQK